MKVVVKPHIQAVHAGTVYGPGDVADIPQHVAYQWLGSGWATSIRQSQAQSQARSSVGGYTQGHVLRKVVRGRRSSEA